MAEKIDIVIQKNVTSRSSGDVVESMAQAQEEIASSQLQVQDIPVKRRAFCTWMMERPQDETRNSSQQRGPMIPKVPELHREQNGECYDPTVVSIGPYHRNNEKLKEMHQLKAKMAREFFQDSKQDIECFYTKVAEVAKDARKCYDEARVTKFDDDEFTQMMIVDGCFILQFMMDCLGCKPENMKMDREKVASVTRDLILLENQLPFKVLNVLLAMRNPQSQIDDFLMLIDEFCRYKIRGLPPQQYSWYRVMKFIGRSILGGKHTIFGFTFSDEENSQVTHLIDYFRILFIGKHHLISNPPKQQLYRYRPTVELKRVGIKFKPSRTNLFTDVKFKSTLFGGTLKLPPIIVDQSTKSLLLNLVAYESCSIASQGREITSYVCFMDSLIDSEQDVAELRSKGIIINFLPDDKAVAELFNKIAHNLVPNHDVYAKVMLDIESYYSSTAKKILVGWWKFYFASPWYFLAYAGAIFVIILTAIQTYLAAFPPRGT